MGNVRRFRNSVGPQIRKIRSQQSLTQDALATRLQIFGLDMDRTAVAKIESQIRSVFDFELRAIASVLNVQMEEFFPTLPQYKRDLPALISGTVFKKTKV